MQNLFHQSSVLSCYLYLQSIGFGQYVIVEINEGCSFGTKKRKTSCASVRYTQDRLIEKNNSKIKTSKSHHRWNTGYLQQVSYPRVERAGLPSSVGILPFANYCGEFFCWLQLRICIVTEAVSAGRWYNPVIRKQLGHPLDPSTMVELCVFDNMVLSLLYCHNQHKEKWTLWIQKNSVG